MKKIISICSVAVLFVAVTLEARTEIEHPATVIITAGQSNADGRMANDSLPQYIRDNGYQYCQWSYGSGTHSGGGEFKPFYPWIAGMNQHDKWAFDAVVYYKLEQLLQERFYVIKESLGGTSIDTLCNSREQMHWCADEGWLKRNAAADKGGKSLLKALTENIDACIDKQLSTLPQGYDIKLMLWHQGESDAAQQDKYYDNLKAVVAYVRHHLMEKTGKEKYATLPVVCGTYARKGRGYNPKVVEALYRLQEEDEDFYVVDVSDATLQSDNLHFDKNGTEILGNRMFDAIVHHQLIASPKDFCWFNGETSICYSINKQTSPVVTTALQMLSEDLRDVTGVTLEKRQTNARIRIVQLDKDKSSWKWLRSVGVPIDSLINKLDAFYMKVHDEQVLVVGSNGRGTAYGILELSRLAGVSPWKWWADVKPERRRRLTMATDFETLQSPTVAYRGLFLNDEDWTLQPWSWRTYSPGKPGLISAQTYKQIFKLLMRLRANAIWPGMHGMTSPFFTIPGAKEVADSCGIVIGTSHCEPMMRNNVGEWKVGERGAFNYITNKENVQNYWIERLKETWQYENYYTIGMRGIHDGPMEGVGNSLNEKTKALQQVIDDQRTLLGKYVNKQVERIPQQFVPYKEVLQVMENGLRLPDDVTLTWCDDNYGYMTRLSDSLQQKRSGGGGVYYHLSYWGRPHDYMWLSTTQPGLIYNEMREAYDHQVRKLWIVNVHDMKTAAYDLELFLDMAWNIHAVQPSTLYEHLKHWLCREFGQTAGEKLLPIMREYYRLTAIRKPEFMGWNQVELDKRKYSRGWSPVVDTEFSLTAFGGELDRYLSDWQQVTAKVEEIGNSLPSSRKDAFFSHVKYPVLSAAAMSRKMLEAQRARAIAKANYDAERWSRDDALMTACAKSQDAYQEIRRLTAYYNNELAGGKWKYSMVDHPRDLYVFYAPTLPVSLTDQEVSTYKDRPNTTVSRIVSDGSFVARNAYQWERADDGAVCVQALGHSMNVVRLPKGKILTYEFECEREGDALLRLAFIPTQPNDTGELRFAVSIDDGEEQVFNLKEPFRSEQWKLNVLRGQAIKNMPVKMQKGKHRLTIKALDNHVVVDQWMLDFNKDRQFYVFPVKPSYEGRVKSEE